MKRSERSVSKPFDGQRDLISQAHWLALWRDRRGAAAIFLSVSAVSLIGLAGLATEGGTWYLEKRHGQNTADAAAIAGVLTLAESGTAAQAVTAGTRVATVNNYVAGTTSGTTTGVAVTTGTYAAGAFTATTTNPNAVQAVITRSPPRLFSGLFLAANPSISEVAIARLDTSAGSACALSLFQPMSFGGNTTINAPGCALASNNPSPTDSINCTGSSSVTAAAFVAVGGVNGCTGTKSLFQPPVQDPFEPIQSVPMPPAAPSTATCQNMPTLPATITTANTYEGGSKMFCNASFGSGQNRTTFTGDLTLTTGQTLNLVPGTYIFYDASISLQGGSLTCTACSPGGQGVTIILTGSSPTSIGTININGNATVTLNAPFANAFNAAFDGVLFYVDNNAAPNNGNGSANVSINGGANTVLNGAIYAPSVPVNYNGNAGGASTCTEIVSYSVNFTGDSSLDTSGCTTEQGPRVPLLQSVHLVL